MHGFGNGSFDPKTLVIVETAFDEAWITLRTSGHDNIRPENSRDASYTWRWKESVTPCNCMTEPFWR
jgi:hypothetical protein